MRIKLLNPALAQHCGEARIESVGERHPVRLFRRHHLMRADLAFKPRTQHRFNGIDMRTH